jgi:2-amino-4-hydroxy-6-hydroxymethyldihydropteridine diphosphokinase
MDVYLGLGSNLGNRLANLQAGLRLLGNDAEVVAVSSLYESAPVGPPGQQPYWNAAACIATDLPARSLLARLKRSEWAMGRRPAEVWSSRPLDLDILLHGPERIDEPDLTIPHPRLHERVFVLIPLTEIAANVPHPVSGRTVAELRSGVDAAGLERIAGPEWLALPYLREPHPTHP